MFLIILVFLSFFKVFAQDPDTICGTPSPRGVPISIAKRTPYVDLTTVDWVDIGIAFHIIRYQDGSGGLDTSLVDDIISILNQAFSGAKIRFFAHTINFINNSNYAYPDSWEEEDEIASIYNISGVINIYFVPKYNSKGSSTFTSDIMEYMRKLGVTTRKEQSIIIKNEFALSSTTPHEVGHYFNLFHTHEDAFGIECPNGSNCETAGDLVCDTPAEPNLDPKPYNDSCRYVGPTKQTNCGNYDINSITEINGRNFMSYAPGHCRLNFTLGQLARIRTTLETTERNELLSKWVKFENRINNLNAGDSLLIDGNVRVKSGSYYGFRDANEHIVRTMRERFNLNKHHDWNRDFSRYKLSNVFSLPSGYTRSEQIANFDSLKPVTISTTLDGNVSNGLIEFRDPWYLHSDETQPNSFMTYSSPFSPTGAYNQTTGGVFLNQGNPPYWDKPYYSIRAPLTQTINGITSYFLGWETSGATLHQVEPNPSGYDQKAVVFTQANAVVKAKYKGHLISGYSGATSGNGSRKIIKTPNDGRIEIFYPSLGRYWRTYSLDNGLTWAKDEDISGFIDMPGDYFFISATPCVYYDGRIEEYFDESLVVWQEYTGGLYKIKYRLISPRSSRNSSGYIDNGFYLSGEKPLPVVSWDGNENGSIMIVYRKGDGLYYVSGNVFYISFTQPQKIPGTDSYCQRPSLSYDVNTGRFVLSYDRNGHIYVTTYSGAWTSPINISNALPATNGFSCIGGVDGSGRVHCVWEGEDVFYTWPAVFHRRSSNSNYHTGTNNWSWITEFITSEEIYKPVCSVHSDADGGVTILFNGSSGNIRRVDSYDNTNWNWGWVEDPFSDPSPPSVASGFNPSAIERVPSPNNLSFIWTKYENQFYRIRYNIEGVQGRLFADVSEGDAPVRGNQRYWRRLCVFDSSGNGFIFELKWIKVVNRNGDTVFVNFSNFDELSSDNFDLGGARRILIGYRFKINGSISLRPKILLNGSSINFTPVEFRGYDEVLTLDLPSGLNGFGNIKFVPTGMGKGFKAEIIHVYYIDNETLEKFAESDKKIDLPIPDKFEVSNYPNPFNPSTNIKFSLPEDSHVQIKVYDALGREIATLLNEERKAGYHEITFDAGDLPSGVYFYRIMAGKFMDVKKMILLK